MNENISTTRIKGPRPPHEPDDFIHCQNVIGGGGTSLHGAFPNLACARLAERLCLLVLI